MLRGQNGDLADAGLHTSMKVTVVPVTPFAQNCTLLWREETRRAAIVDPGDEIERSRLCVYGLIYPRQRWLTRFGAAAGGFFLWLIRSDFRPYIHDPGQIETWIIAEGFQKCFEDKTAIWLTQVYIRP